MTLSGISRSGDSWSHVILPFTYYSISVNMVTFEMNILNTYFIFVIIQKGRKQYLTKFAEKNLIKWTKDHISYTAQPDNNNDNNTWRKRWLHLTFLGISNSFKFYLFIYFCFADFFFFFWMCVCVAHVCSARGCQREYHISCDRSFRYLWVNRWVLGVEPDSSKGLLVLFPLSHLSRPRQTLKEKYSYLESS